MSFQSAVTAAETPAANGHGEAHSTAGFKALMLGSIGVVYGDIGTSPLYALREALLFRSHAHLGALGRLLLPMGRANDAGIVRTDAAGTLAGSGSLRLHLGHEVGPRAEAADADSTLSLYRRALATRRAAPELHVDEFAWIDGPDGTLYAHATTTCLVFELPAQK